VFPVRCELRFSISEDILHTHRRENLKAHIEVGWFVNCYQKAIKGSFSRSRMTLKTRDLHNTVLESRRLYIHRRYIRWSPRIQVDTASRDPTLSLSNQAPLLCRVSSYIPPSTCSSRQRSIQFLRLTFVYLSVYPFVLCDTPRIPLPPLLLYMP
jgi:hypothetical protein